LPNAPVANSEDALFDFENSVVEMTDTETHGSRKLIRAKESKVKTTRWWHLP
jgi:hypothetical protein